MKKTKFKHPVRLTLGLLAGVLLIFGVFILSGKLRNSWLLRTESPKAIALDTWFQVNGTRQHVLLRGENEDNPIVLVIYDGPKAPVASVLSVYHHALEKKFTLAYWEPRGAGRTHWENRSHPESAGIRQTVQDMDVVVDLLCRQFNKNKVFLLTYSWSCPLGWEYATSHAGKVTGWIGVGPYVEPLPQPILYSSAEALLRLREQGEEAVAEEMEMLRAELAKSADLREFGYERWQQLESLTERGVPNGDAPGCWTKLWRTVTAPQSDWRDVRSEWMEHFSPATAFAIRLPYMESLTDASVMRKDSFPAVPVTFVVGELDTGAPWEPVQEFVEEQNASSIRLERLPDRGHHMLEENPDQVTDLLLTVLTEMRAEIARKERP